MPAFHLLEERKKERVVGDGSVPLSHLVVGVITHPRESWEMPFAEAAFVFGKHFPKRKFALRLRQLPPTGSYTRTTRGPHEASQLLSNITPARRHGSLLINHLSPSIYQKGLGKVR